METVQTKAVHNPITEHEMKQLVSNEAARLCIMMNTSVNKIFYRKMKTKWASCSSSKNLTINPSTRYLPKNLILYVVYHEILHTIERKHNTRFWTMIEAKYPNHMENEKDLFAYWFLLQNRKYEIHKKRIIV